MKNKEHQIHPIQISAKLVSDWKVTRFALKEKYKLAKQELKLPTQQELLKPVIERCFEDDIRKMQEELDN